MQSTPLVGSMSCGQAEEDDDEVHLGAQGANREGRRFGAET
jgi:hypothetical protein